MTLDLNPIMYIMLWCLCIFLTESILVYLCIVNFLKHEHITGGAWWEDELYGGGDFSIVCRMGVCFMIFNLFSYDE